jgi:hypothetical protein
MLKKTLNFCGVSDTAIPVLISEDLFYGTGIIETLATVPYPHHSQLFPQ